MSCASLAAYAKNLPSAIGSPVAFGRQMTPLFSYALMSATQALGRYFAGRLRPKRQSLSNCKGEMVCCHDASQSYSNGAGLGDTR